MTMQTDTQASPDATVIAEQDEEAKVEAAIDWKAKFETSDAERAKLGNDLRALKGLRMSEEQREARMQEILDHVATIDQQNAALLKAFGDNTVETLPAEVEKIQSEGRQVQERRRFDSVYESLRVQFQEAVTDTDGKAIFTKDSPELSDALQLWNATLGSLKEGKMTQLEAMGLFSRAVGQAHGAARAKLTARLQAEAKKPPRKPAAKEQSDEDDGLDMDTGPAAGSAGGVGSWAQAQKIKKVTDLSDADYEKLIAKG